MIDSNILNIYPLREKVDSHLDSFTFESKEILSSVDILMVSVKQAFEIASNAHTVSLAAVSKMKVERERHEKTMVCSWDKSIRAKLNVRNTNNRLDAAKLKSEVALQQDDIADFNTKSQGKILSSNGSDIKSNTDATQTNQCRYMESAMDKGNPIIRRRINIPKPHRGRGQRIYKHERDSSSFSPHLKTTNNIDSKIRRCRKISHLAHSVSTRYGGDDDFEEKYRKFNSKPGIMVSSVFESPGQQARKIRESVAAIAIQSYVRRYISNKCKKILILLLSMRKIIRNANVIKMQFFRTWLNYTREIKRIKYLLAVRSRQMHIAPYPNIIIDQILIQKIKRKGGKNDVAKVYLKQRLLWMGFRGLLKNFA